MTAPNGCCHKIKVVNFKDNEVITYSIVRLIGIVESTPELECSLEGNEIRVTSNGILKEKAILPKNNKFKILLELVQGTNNFVLKYGCQEVTIHLVYLPLDTDYTVMPMYVICEGHNGLFQAPVSEKNDTESACERILLCSKLLQCFTAEKLAENGLGRKTFNLEKTCQIFRSKIHYLDAQKMSQEELWKNIGRDIMNSEFASEKRKYLAFLSCTLYNGEAFVEDRTKTHEDLLKITSGYVALGGGGLALFGTACLYTWPENLDDVISRFEDVTKIDKSKFLDDSCYRGTKGACFSTTLGSVLHELYHTFDLGHTDTGVMGRGFDNIRKFFIADEGDPKQEEIIKSYHSQIEFKEEFESDTLSERLVNEHKRKNFHITRQFEENDWTFLTKSCAVILAYHKWFNSITNSTPCTLVYDSSTKFIRSTAGIRVIEIRKQPDEVILYDWIFTGKVLKFSFRIPDETITDGSSLIVFVEDNQGNILKQIL